KFQVPHGDTPDAIRNNPALRGMNIPKTGQGGSVGILVTKTLVIAGDPALTAPPGRARGAMLRAYNKQTGEQVGEVLMPAPITGRRRPSVRIATLFSRSSRSTRASQSRLSR